MKLPTNPDGNVAVVLPPVTDLSLNRTEAMALSWTFGKEPIREHAGVRQQSITINGRSGIQHRLGSKGASQGDLFADGPKLFREIEAFLEHYQNTSADLQKVGFRKSQPVLEFHAINEQKHLKVEVQRFNWRKAAATSRHSYEWTLDMVSYGDSVDAAQNILGAFVELMQNVTDAVDSVTAFPEKYTLLVRDARTSLNSIFKPLEAVARFSSAIGNVMHSLAGVVSFPKALVDKFLKLTEQATQDIYNGWYSLEGATGFFTDKSGLIDAIEAIHDARMDCLVWFGAAGLDSDAFDAKSKSVHGWTTVNSDTYYKRPWTTMQPTTQQ